MLTGSRGHNFWEVRRIVDLSLPLSGETVVYPGDPVPRITRIAAVEKDGYNLHSLTLGSQSGTHVDAPNHVLKNGLTVDLLDLRLFAAEGVLLNLRDKGENGEITLEDVREVEPLLHSQSVVLFNTGWSQKASGDGIFNHPYLGETACRFLLGKGVRSFGIDAINLDPHHDTGFPAHRLIAEHGGVILENLINLDRIDFPRPLVVFFPLKVPGVDGSPVRAAALEMKL